MTLTKPHPLWTTAGSSPAKIAMATVQARMLSGRYRTGLLCSNWTHNMTGNCVLSPGCSNKSEDIVHILTSCEALETTRERLRDYTKNYAITNPLIAPILSEFCVSTSYLFVQFLLDCSVIPSVIAISQKEGTVIHDHLFEITRTWVYTLHKQRLKLLGRWNFI